MKKINTRDLAESNYASPKGKYASCDREISEALGREDGSTDLLKRHPFDVEICRIPAGKAMCPYHSHSAQWEFYHVLSGRGQVRHEGGLTPLGDPAEDLVLYIVADNPIGESCHYPDSGKWMVRSPERRLLRSEPLDYFDGEE
jgi:uncharacterized cupin superfamily protein